jgi:hypothetical protein
MHTIRKKIKRKHGGTAVSEPESKEFKLSSKKKVESWKIIILSQTSTGAHQLVSVIPEA